MTIELDPDDPLHPRHYAPVKVAEHIPRRNDSFAGIEWRALASRSNDDIFPPLVRLCLYLQIRSLHGRKVVKLNNGELLDIGLSRFQKYRLLRRLEEDGRIAIDQSRGCYPKITILRPWW